MNEIELVPITSVQPSTYNPRRADPRRLKIIELSLRKLGFVLPIYADPDGEIISGHQRHHVATLMGVQHIPVVRMERMHLTERKNANVVFNRGTNDLARDATPGSLTEALQQIDLDALAAPIPDKTPDTPEFYPCLRAEERPIRPYVEANSGRWVQYAKSISGTLRGFGVVMPIVCGPDGRVVNGIGRLQMLAEHKADTVSVVDVTEAEAELAAVMLNLLSMDFDIHNRYADDLRMNSFRRSYQIRPSLGYGFTFSMSSSKAAKEHDIHDPEMWRKWKKIHGTSVVDFGAGLLIETGMLRDAGVHVAAFEPFRLTPGTMTINPTLGRVLNVN